jgi:hypothetical protein
MKTATQEEFHKAINTGEDCVISSMSSTIEKSVWVRRHSGKVVGASLLIDGGRSYELAE